MRFVYCDQAFKTSIDMKNHERILITEKPFACYKSDKAFRDSGKLKIHERIHKKEKPCNKTLTESSSLKMHERTHERSHLSAATVEKPFDSSNVTRHPGIVVN